MADGTAVPGRATPAPRAKKLGLVARMVRFYREVVFELRKVLWPTRRELVGYTFVVLVFVAFMVALVAGLDFVFTKGVMAVFG